MRSNVYRMERRNEKGEEGREKESGGVKERRKGRASDERGLGWAS